MPCALTVLDHGCRQNYWNSRNKIYKTISRGLNALIHWYPDIYMLGILLICLAHSEGFSCVIIAVFEYFFFCVGRHSDKKYLELMGKAYFLVRSLYFVMAPQSAGYGLATLTFLQCIHVSPQTHIFSLVILTRCGMDVLCNTLSHVHPVLHGTLMWEKHRSLLAAMPADTKDVRHQQFMSLILRHDQWNKASVNDQMNISNNDFP